MFEAQKYKENMLKESSLYLEMLSLWIKLKMRENASIRII